MYENIEKSKGLWESFDDIDGLGHECGCLLEDREGNLWIGTDNGLSRYDGRRFIIFTDGDGLGGNSIQCIHQDKKGDLWIGTNNGLSRYDGSEFVNFTDEDGLISNYTYCMHQDREGNIWIGTDKGLSRYDGSQFVDLTDRDGLASNQVYCICQDRDNDLWFGTSKGLSRYNGKEFVDFAHEDVLRNTHIWYMAQDAEDNIWLAAYNGLFRYDGERFTNFTQEDGLPDNNVRCICQGREGEIWVGTLNGGASCYDGSKFVDFNTESGLAHNTVFDILQDREGSLWFTCYHGGVSRYSPYHISSISSESVDEVITQDGGGDLWWGFGNILSQFGGNDTNHYPFEHNIFEIFEDSTGHFWIGTDGGGIYRYNSIKDFCSSYQAGQNLTVDDGLANNRVTRIYEDAQGNIWVGTRNGLSLYDGMKFTNFTTDDGLASNVISVIFQDMSGTLWFGGWGGGGVTRYDGKTFRSYTKDDGLVDEMVLCIVEDDKNSLWIGTSAGIICFDGESFKNYTTADGFLGTFIQRMIRDSRGHLWIATLGGGVSRFDGRNFQSLTTEDGLPSNCVTGIVEDPDGSVVISTYRGICRYVPDYETPPPIRIDEVDADRIYEAPEDIQLSEDVSSIRIRYHGVSFETKRMRYNYILEGYDRDWGATWGEEVRYENLPIGEYTFKVIAISKDLVHSEKPAELKLRVVEDPRDMVINELEEMVRERTAELRKHRDHLEELVEERTRELRESEEMYRTIFETTGTAAVMVEEDTIISLVNTEFEKLSGYSREEIEGKRSWTEFATEEALERLSEYHRLRRIDPDTAPGNYEAQFINSKGEVRDCLITVSMITGTKKSVVFVVDITEHKEEAERIQVAKMEALRQLVAGVAHQMNSPIGAITGNSDVSSRAVERIRRIITEEYPQGLGEHEQLTRVLTVLEKANQVGQAAADGIAKIVANLRHFVRLDEAEWQFADIHEGMDSVIALMASELSNRIEITRDYGDIQGIYCSPSNLNQVFMSILKNASEAIVGKGEICLRTTDQGDCVEVEISDTGRGIPAEDIDRIFDPGFTTKGVRVGVGLGLSICHKIIVNEHNGHIDVSSEPGKGTTFAITIPKHRDRRRGNSG